MIFISSPYSDVDKAVVTSRYHESLKFLEHFVSRGIPAISIIAMCHNLDLENTTPEFWSAFYTPILKSASEVAVLMIDGWEDSVGVQDEVRTALSLHIPVTFYRFIEGEYRRAYTRQY